jgi:hypothetical protein
MDGAGRQILGIPYGDFWLFRMISGRINTYYPLSEGRNLFTHIQKDDGPIIPFTPQALKDMVDSDPAIVDMITQKGNFLKAIKRYNQYHRN